MRKRCRACGHVQAASRSWCEVCHSMDLDTIGGGIDLDRAFTWAGWMLFAFACFWFAFRSVPA